jgi:hypothetical protein
MSDDRNIRLGGLCGTCDNWAQGASHFATEPVTINPDSDRGACLCAPPVMLQTRDGNAVTVHPLTHETRTCEMWAPILEETTEDDPDPLRLPGQPHLRTVEDEPRAAA